MADTEIQSLKDEVAKLHKVLEGKGINSKGTTDAFGREFTVPVDAEHKATKLVLCNFSNPHNRAFHTSWFGFFSSFFSMFAAAPLIPFMRKSTSLNLSKAEIGLGNILALSSNIVMRVVIGYISDLVGPRKGMAFLLLVSSPAIVGMMFVQSAVPWIICRTVIGIGLATFVTCQVWNSQMYNKSIVGIANATAAGWGNLGGGVTNLVTALLFSAIISTVKGTGAEREDTAWRLCYILPLCLHLIGGIAVLTGRDLPDGNYGELEKSGAKQKGKTSVIVKTGLSNVNAWVLTATYGMCFGVELTMNSIVAAYIHDYHGLPMRIAGPLGATYGLMNLFARSVGGWMSDEANKYFGMRGRLWACWIVQTIEGIFCIIMGMLTIGLDSPWKQPMTQGYTLINKEWVPVNGTMVPKCGIEEKVLDESFVKAYGLDDGLYVVAEPPSTGANCILHQNMAAAVVFVMILFSLCVQAAEGLHYGIVPYVSRPALGIVSGMVGAGGNLGGVIGLRAFFFGGINRADQAFINLGIMVICVTLSMFFIYFPDKGGMLFPAGGLGKYDPQLVKPPEDYRGADSLDLSTMNKTEEKTSTTDAVSTA